MIYGASITCAAQGSQADATRTTLEISKGLIWLIEVDMPPGCVGLVAVQVFDGKYQLFPTSPGYALVGDGQLFKYDDVYLKESAPYELTIVTWNSDELWDHTIQVRVGVASSRAFMSRYLPSISWDDYLQALDEARAMQQQVSADQAIAIIERIQTG